MDKNKVEMIMRKYKGNIDSSYLSQLRTDLESLDNSHCTAIYDLPIKKKITTLLLSLFLGGFAADRFYLGDKNVGGWRLFLRIAGVIFSIIPGISVLGSILTFITAIWGFFDMFACYRLTKTINYDVLHMKINSCLNADRKKREQEARRQQEAINTQLVQDTIKEEQPVYNDDILSNEEIIDTLYSFSSELGLSGKVRDNDYVVKFVSSLLIKDIEASLVFSIQSENSKVVCRLDLGDVQDLSTAKELEEAFNDKYKSNSDDILFYAELKVRVIDNSTSFQIVANAEFEDGSSLEEALFDIVGKYVAVTNAEYDRLCSVVCDKGENDG